VGSEFLVLAIALILAGSVPGLLASLLRVSGGAVTNPRSAIYCDQRRRRLAHAPDHRDVARCQYADAIASYLARRKKGAAEEVALRLLALPTVSGVTLGSALSTIAPAELFKTVPAAVSAAVGRSLLVGSKATRLRQDLPGSLAMRIVSFVIGILSPLMGISGGMLTNMMMLACERSTVGLVIFISIPGAIGYTLAGWPQMSVLPPLSFGYVSVPGAILLSIVGMWMSLSGPIGPRNRATAARIGFHRLSVDDGGAFCCCVRLVIASLPFPVIGTARRIGYLQYAGIPIRTIPTSLALSVHKSRPGHLSSPRPSR